MYDFWGLIFNLLNECKLVFFSQYTTHNFINGKFVESATNDFFELRSPATNEVCLSLYVNFLHLIPTSSFR